MTRRDGDGGDRSDRGASADVAFIRALARLANANALDEIEVERFVDAGDKKPRRIRVRIARAGAGRKRAKLSAPPAPEAPASAPSESAPRPRQAKAAQPDALPPDRLAPGSPGLVASPMVGTVYLAPEPGAGPFVSLGEQVSEGQNLLIIEAMKTMNHITAPRTGMIAEILVRDGQPVEYGAPLMLLDV